jgi:hypothetical protein
LTASWSGITERRETFASNVLLMYDRGLRDPEKLHSFCLIIAQHQFAEPLESGVLNQAEF